MPSKYFRLQVKTMRVALVGRRARCSGFRDIYRINQFYLKLWVGRTSHHSSTSWAANLAPNKSKAEQRGRTSFLVQDHGLYKPYHNLSRAQ